MFSFRSAPDVITLFSKAGAPATLRISKALDAARVSAATKASEAARANFDVSVTELPTQDQLQTILSYVGGSNAGQVISGATSEEDAIKKFKSDSSSFKRPLVVDWNSGKAIVSEDESEIIKMVKALH